MTILLLTRDLLFGSQIAGAAQAAGYSLRDVASGEGLHDALGELVESGGALDGVLIDLTCPGLRDGLAEWVGAVRAVDSSVRIVAYGPHVQEGLLAGAQQAGCDQVLTRGQLHRSLAAGFAELFAS